MQTLEIMFEGDKGEDSVDAESMSDWTTENVRIIDRLPELDSADMSDGNKENKAMKERS